MLLDMADTLSALTVPKTGTLGAFRGCFCSYRPTLRDIRSTSALFLVQEEKVLPERTKQKTSRKGWFSKLCSGGRTRTCDLRVMSPTSYRLLYPAVLDCKGRNFFPKSKF